MSDRTKTPEDHVSAMGKPAESGRIVSINVSPKKGVRKTPVKEALLKENYGIEGDAHASSSWHRQVSLLAIESIGKAQCSKNSAKKNLEPGDFAENITTKGLALAQLPIGTKLLIGQSLTEVTQIGKRCHEKCEIYRETGDCIMPREGIFVKVLSGGPAKAGDPVSVLHITAAVITLSDKGSKGERIDESGPLINELLAAIGAGVLHYEVIPDEEEILKERLLKYSALVDLVVTTGGTGLTARDVTPEATAAVIERHLPGIAEAMRACGMQKTKRAMLSRGIAGTRGTCLIINLPGSPKAVRESLEAVLDVIPHAISKIKGQGEDCAL
ncbi:MAG: molybdopterin-binding protein [Nitrospiraceae bacterium]|nr:molybdopterin-binding protein [Nitrospiraceae bacterium]